MKAVLSCSIEDQPRDFVGVVIDQRLFKKSRQRRFRQHHLRRDAFLGLAAATLARQSPDRSCEALAMTSRRSAKANRVAPTFVLYRRITAPATQPTSGVCRDRR